MALAQGKSAIWSPNYDSTQQLSLIQMKRLATGLFLLVAALFLSASYGERFWPWLSWMTAFSEAAMVGALADWFAVVALFRHPLGLRIPHTAIIPNNKERIASTLAQFIQSNFLSAEVLPQKIEQLDPGSKIAHWLSSPKVNEKISASLSNALQHILGSLEDTKIQSFLQHALGQLMASIKLAPLCGNVLEIFVSGGKHHAVLDILLRNLETLLERHSDQIKRLLREEMPWYVPNFLHERVYKSLVLRAHEIIKEINQNSSHPVRAWAAKTLDDLIIKLKNSAEFEAKGDELRCWLLSEPAFKEYSLKLAKELSAKISEDLSASHSQIKEGIKIVINAFARDLNQNQEMRAKFNASALKLITIIIERYRHDIIAFLEDTVRRWDSRTLIDKIEIQVGKDLQYIRLNGTLVGGLAGLVIHAVNEMVFQ